MATVWDAFSWPTYSLSPFVRSPILSWVCITLLICLCCKHFLKALQPFTGASLQSYSHRLLPRFGLPPLRQLLASSLRGCLSPCLPKSSLANDQCSPHSRHFGSISWLLTTSGAYYSLVKQYMD